MHSTSPTGRLAFSQTDQSPSGHRACPSGWDARAQAYWNAGEQKNAIDAALAVFNGHGPKKPVALVLQVVYYLYLIGDPAAAAHLLGEAHEHYPQHPEVLKNLAVCLARSHRYAEAVDCWRDFLTRHPDTPVAFDSLSRCLHRLGQEERATEAGTRALSLKDQAQAAHPDDWSLPQGTPAEFADAPEKNRVIAFSLWGENPRYLRGAIDNALGAPTLYPGWTLRFFVDASVPQEICRTLTLLGADVRIEAPGQSTRQRLTWRFKVANDPTVGRFLVRDVDSVINQREKLAVDAWMASDCWFHVMRDWWTHTDLILAGMWGGVAGVLPALPEMLASYTPTSVETPNIDQWFLRDKVWCYVRRSCLVHDRCFTHGEVHAWPGPVPTGNIHVGQDVFAVQRQVQEARLGNWLGRLKSLQLRAA